MVEREKGKVLRPLPHLSIYIIPHFCKKVKIAFGLSRSQSNSAVVVVELGSGSVCFNSGHKRIMYVLMYAFMYGLECVLMYILMYILFVLFPSFLYILYHIFLLKSKFYFCGILCQVQICTIYII